MESKEYLWAFDRNAEEWNYFEGTLEECLKHIKEQDECRSFCDVYIGEYRKYNPKEYISKDDTDSLLDAIVCKSDNLCWLDEITEEDKQILADELDTVFRTWLKVKKQEPNFGEPVNITEYRNYWS